MVSGQDAWPSIIINRQGLIMVYPPPAVKETDFPILQVALDHIDPEEALRLAGQAARGGADWIEAGTPLIKSAGMSVVREARREAPNIPLVAEMKPLDVGRTELELAFKAGADMAIITGSAPLTTISECVQAARLFRKKIILDTRGMEDLLGKEKAQGLLKYIQQNYHEYLTEPLPGSRIITSLEIKQRGVWIVRKLKELFPDRGIIADLKALHGADREIMVAFEAGADVACVAAAAGLAEIQKAVAVARGTGRRVMVDLIGIRDHLGEEAILKLAGEIAEAGVDYLCYHVPIDDQVKGRRIPPGSVKRIARELSIPLAIAGGINRNSAPHMIEAGAKIIIVGGAIAKAPKPEEATRQIKQAARQGRTFPILQAALDVSDLDEAVRVAEKAAPYLDWLEVGSILATRSGMEAVKTLRALFPDKVIVDDLKVVDFGPEEVELAAQAGADIIVLWGAARKATILMAIRRAKELGIQVMVDIGQEEPLDRAKRRAKELESMGVDYVVYLIPKDEQIMGRGISPPTVSALKKILTVPLAVAGGLDAQTAPKVLEAGAQVLIIGEAIYKSQDPGHTAKMIREAMEGVTSVRLPPIPSVSEIVIETVTILANHVKEVAQGLDEQRVQQFLKVIISANRAILAGVGRSRLVGKLAKNWLAKSGLDVRVIETGDEDVPPDFSYKSGDILIPVSASGKTPSIVDYSAILRKKGRGIIQVLPVTAKPHGPAWHEDDLVITIHGRTKEDWAKEKESKAGQRVPLGTLSEFATLVFLMAATQAIMERRPSPERVKEVMFRIAAELAEAHVLMESQRNSLDQAVAAILETKWKGSRVVLDGFGRVERINSMFASRLIQVYGLNPMLLRGDITAKIRDLDTVIVSSLSGEIFQIYKTLNHCLSERGMTPVYLTGLGDSPARQLIHEGKVMYKEQTLAEGKVIGIFVPGTVARRGKMVSFSERQFIEGKRRIFPLDNTAEIMLLAMFEGIFACLLERLGLGEEHLQHAELE